MAHVKLEITQDKLVDLLLHAATREDIQAFAKASKEDYAKLDQKIDSGIARVERSMEAMEARMDRRFHKIDGRYNWIIRTMLACFITLTGLIGHWLHAF
jgi:hypothetical protein